MIKNEYAEPSSGEVKEGQTWYLPHHGVYHPQKPEKIRVVFDCSATCNNRSINKELLSGPDLANQIVGVLIRFRVEEIAFMADIKSMFYQVLVPPHQRSLLRFLWWKDGDFSKEILEYQMCTHIFGGASSPSCSNYALKKQQLTIDTSLVIWQLKP